VVGYATSAWILGRRLLRNRSTSRWAALLVGWARRLYGNRDRRQNRCLTDSKDGRHPLAQREIVTAGGVGHAGVPAMTRALHAC